MAPLQLRQPRPDPASFDARRTGPKAAKKPPFSRDPKGGASLVNLNARPTPAPTPATAHDDVTLLELLDRALDKGVVLTGDITLSVANVDLVYVGLRLLLTSVETMRREMEGAGSGADEPHPGSPT
jgi:hypothetical protein